MTAQDSQTWCPLQRLVIWRLPLSQRSSHPQLLGGNGGGPLRHHACEYGQLPFRHRLVLWSLHSLG
jgi:hypothetical protein